MNNILLKNNFFAHNYDGTRFYRKTMDTGSLIYKLNYYFRRDYIYE